MANRRLAITRRFSLASVAENWTDDCYVEYQPSSYRDYAKWSAKRSAGMPPAEAAKQIVDFVREHVVGGQCFILSSESKPVLSPLTKEDVEDLPPETVTALFSAMTGGDLVDPKATSPAQPSAKEPSTPPEPTASS